MTTTFVAGSWPFGSAKWFASSMLAIGMALLPTMVMASCEEIAEVVLTAPANGVSVAAPATVTFNAQVFGVTCAGRRVIFIINGQPEITDTASPWSYTRSNLTPGTYTVWATVQDAAGESNSPPITVNVTNPISISITSPAGGTVAASPASFTINAATSDSTGTITQVEFISNGAVINTDTSAPFSYVYPNVGAGSYSLVAKATDNHGIVATSAPVNVISNNVPSVSLTSPANGASALVPGAFTVSANASDSDGSITKVEFYSNGSLINTATSAPYSYTYSGLGSGSYSILAKAYDNRNAVTTSGTATVSVNSAPSVTLTAPANGASGLAPAMFTLSANASDSDGSINRVEFYSNGGLVNTDSVAPYTYSYAGVGSGTYAITARTYDNLGATTNSGASTVSVNSAPSVTLTAPANGATGTAPANFTLTASASDSDGSINRVEFYSDGALVNTDTIAPYTYVQSGLGAGSHAIYAKAFDNLGAFTSSGTATVSVNAPPSVSLTSPANGASALAPANLTLTASASDSDGTISKVEFYSNSVLIYTDIVAPYSYAYTNLAVGNYALTARAYDNLNAPTTSSTVNASVVPNGAPTVYMTAPTDGSIVLAPASLTLTANASDSDGSISKVEFYSNGVLINTDTATPFSFAYSGLGAGSYALTAKAFDDLNVATVSGAVNVVVNAPPVVSMTSPSTGASGVAPATFALSANATDSDGSITKVEFYSNGTLVDTDTASPYATTYSGVAAGSYSLTAKAYDNRSAVTTSGAVTVSVNATPSVSLTSPSHGSTGTAPATFTVSATASDPDGSIAKVEFFSNGALFATDTTSPFSVSLASLGQGTYVLSAKATDNLGLASPLSNSATVTVGAQSGVAVTRSYVYDTYERLCKTIEPETGATIVDYDGANNVAWSVQGSGLTSSSCDRGSVLGSDRIVRGYDARNRILSMLTPGAAADIVTTYFPDGSVATISANNPGAGPVINRYSYNNRRMLVAESVEEASPSLLFTTNYFYNQNGHLSSLQYPDQEMVGYAPNALGQPSQVGPYATGISYYPNGAIHQFSYGNGVVHTMTQNTRQLPTRSRDVYGSTVILDDSYIFDANGNVTDITDQAQGGLTTRGMAYDSRDRLTVAVAPGLWGDAAFAYDGVDNLVKVDQGTRHYRYSYSGNQQLSQINDPNGVPQVVLGYDPTGNVNSKNGQTLVFDIANRLTQLTGVQYYRYDGLGRRAQTTDQDGKYTFWQYSQAGQVLFASEARKSRNTAYIYLGNTQVAARHVAWGSGTQTVEYQHTDALGSPVAETSSSGAVTKRIAYTPHGEVSGGGVVDGPGYTGHVMDAATGLTYMQQRYYDPRIGRFLSVDPVTADGNTGGNFNRYWYASNNPYRFTDPDGRLALVVEVGIPLVIATGAYLTWTATTTPEQRVEQVQQVLDKVKGVFNESVVDNGEGEPKEPIPGAADLTDDLAGQELIGEIEAGEGKVLPGMGDKKFDPETGTHDKVAKSRTNADGTKTELHAERNRETGKVDDAKIKQDYDSSRENLK